MGTITYYGEPVTLTADISGYEAGDYAQVYSDKTTGAIDWNVVFDPRKFQLTDPQWTVLGWGVAPWGISAWGTGYTTMAIVVMPNLPGMWLFGLKTFDALGNAQSGLGWGVAPWGTSAWGTGYAVAPAEDDIYVTPRPKEPGVMAQSSYDSANDILTLTVET